MIIVLEFSKGEKVSPVILTLIDKYPQVLLQLLIDPFCLAVSLRMVSSSRSQLDAKNPIELSGEFRYELRSTVRHDLPRKSMVFPNMLDEEARSACRCDSGECGCKMCPFCYRVHH